MVFQNYALYPHMSVFDNMAFGLKLRKMPAADIRERVGETARLLGLERYLDRKPRALSGGERQRVALGRALVRRPRLFLFDEPLSNLDAKLRTHMRAEIARIHHQLATTMIYVTHDQVEAMTLGQRIAVLESGRLQQCDDPMTVYRHPANRFVAGFIGSPAMNFLDATLGEGGATIEVGGRALEVPAPRRVPGGAARRVVLGVRPEHFALGPEGSAIPATVAVREPLGNEVLVHADTRAGEVVVRLQRDGGPAVGTAVSLIPDLAEAHLFDPDTGAVLGT
jgi:multiple sugar transport system ATP-binding protein